MRSMRAFCLTRTNHEHIVAKLSHRQLGGRLNQQIRLTNEPGGLGLSCTETGLSLAGAALLRKSASGFSPRPAREIIPLLLSAYGRGVDVANVTARLGHIAGALNRGDPGGAMIASLRLNLPELNWDAAVRVAQVEDALAKYNPDQPRDWHGRWTSGSDESDESGDGPHLFGGRLIPIADGPNLGIGGNGPPPEAESISEVEPTLETPRVPSDWEIPGHTIDGLSFPPSRDPKLKDGTPWPKATTDVVLATLARTSGREPPRMVLFVPRDGVGPTLVGSTLTISYERPAGYDVVELVGTPQETRRGGQPTNHAKESVVEALNLASTNHFSKIFFNRSITHVTGGDHISLIRPDVTGVARETAPYPHHFIIVEILSNGQTREMRQVQMPQSDAFAPVRGRRYKRLRRIHLEILLKLGVWPLCL